MIRRTCTIGY